MHGSRTVIMWLSSRREAAGGPVSVDRAPSSAHVARWARESSVASSSSSSSSFGVFVLGRRVVADGRTDGARECVRRRRRTARRHGGWRGTRRREAETRAICRTRRGRGRTRRLVRTDSARTRSSEGDSARARVDGGGKDRTITSEHPGRASTESRDCRGRGRECERRSGVNDWCGYC